MSNSQAPESNRTPDAPETGCNCQHLQTTALCTVCRQTLDTLDGNEGLVADAIRAAAHVYEHHDKREDVANLRHIARVVDARGAS